MEADSARARAAADPEARQRLERDSSAVFRVPCLPAASPAAPTPPELKLQLHEHQGRALHRCLLIERDGALPKSFNLLGDGLRDVLDPRLQVQQ